MGSLATTTEYCIHQFIMNNNLVTKKNIITQLSGEHPIKNMMQGNRLEMGNK